MEESGDGNFRVVGQPEKMKFVSYTPKNTHQNRPVSHDGLSEEIPRESKQLPRDKDCQSAKADGYKPKSNNQSAEADGGDGNVSVWYTNADSLPNKLNELKLG